MKTIVELKCFKFIVFLYCCNNDLKNSFKIEKYSQ